jgi:hypothetical protein
LHPWFNHEQSTRFDSESETRFPVETKWAPSSDPVEENAQHDPHCPWSFTGVTAPLVTQLISSARFSSEKRVTFLSGIVSTYLYPFNFFNSSKVRSAKKLIPTVDVWPFYELCYSINANFYLNYSNLKLYSALVP